MTAPCFHDDVCAEQLYCHLMLCAPRLQYRFSTMGLITLQAPCILEPGL